MQPRSFALATVAVLLAAIGVSTTAAQTTVSLAAGAGIAVPTSGFGTGHSTGYLGNAKLSIYPNRRGLGLQVDLGYGHFGGKGTTSDFRPFTAMGSLLVSPWRGGAVRPYLLAGAGLMAQGNVNNRYTRFALQGGAGLSVGAGPASAFIEGRYVSSVEAISVASYIPILAGAALRLR